mmetsp:Transcript_10979/g.19785  ORF Transcript_10979/g.19785 Transcript_10979/m.19785 type:complete len:291 (-) Transcript_10979:85-957(-)
MPRRRPPKHVREATRAAREKGEEPPQVKPSENKPLFSNPRSEAKFGDQLRDKIAKAQIQAKQKLTGFAREANCQKPMLNLGISPLVLQGKWSDVAGNTVNVYPCDNYCNSFWVTLTRPCGPDINLTLRASPNGKGWYCGSARLDERGSTLTQLIWEFFNGEISIWTRNVQSNEQFDPFGSSCMDYYGYEDGLYVVPHMLTPICDFHNNLITSPMCYVVMSKVQAKSFERQLPALASGARSSADDACALAEQPPQSGVDQGDEELYYDYAQGNHVDYADNLYGASSCGDYP